jgi:hypothetical protein
MYIHGDGELLYTSPAITAGIEPVSFSVDISNVDVLKITLYGSGMIRVVDCVLSASADAEFTSSRIDNNDNTEHQQVSFIDLDWFNASDSRGGLTAYTLVKDNMGNTYGNGFGGNNGFGDNFREVNLGGAYKKIQGTIVLNYDNRTQTNDKALMYIHGDGELLYTSPAITAGIEPVSFSVDISGVAVLKITLYGSGMIRVVDCVLSDSADAEFISSRIDNNDNTEHQQVSFIDLDWFNASDSRGGLTAYTLVKDNVGNTYGNGFGGNNGFGDNFRDVRLGGAYKKIQGTIVLNYDNRTQTNDRAIMYIHGDGELLYTSPAITAGIEPVSFSVDISGVDVLKITLYGSGMIRVVDCVLSDSADAG